MKGYHTLIELYFINLKQFRYEKPGIIRNISDFGEILMYLIIIIFGVRYAKNKYRKRKLDKSTEMLNISDVEENVEEMLASTSGRQFRESREPPV